MSAINDPVADMLTRIRNAIRARHKFVDIPASKVKEAVAKILAEHRFIAEYKRLEDGKQGMLRILLRYEAGECVIRGLRRVSKPGIRQYRKATELPRVMNGLGIAVISTSRGILSDKKARQLNVGGEVVAYIW